MFRILMPVMLCVSPVITISTIAFAADPLCVQINNINTPERLSGFNGHEGPDLERFETWCYQTKTEDFQTQTEGLAKNENSKTLTLVYKLTGGGIRPELSALVESTGGKIQTVTHASLMRGQLTYHKMSGFLNPLGAPLTYDEAIKAGARPVSNFRALSLTSRGNQIYESLKDVHTETFHPQVTAGVFEASIPNDKVPWDGGYWNDSGLPLAAGPLSPLGKYDNIIQSWTGTNPKSVDWEAKNHSDTSVSWGGHCNGWAASSVLYDEPQKFLWDDKNKVVVLPSDIKGMLSESSFCVNWAFFGNRYWGNPGDDLLDIYPDLFHKVLLYYIGQLQKPIAHDYYRNEHVDNNIIGGYKFTITADAANKNLFHVIAELQRYRYSERSEIPGKAEEIAVAYNYDLTTDAQGNIVKGVWTGDDNPDFLWVPLSPAEGSCGWRNPNVDPDKIVQIQGTLPAAVTKTVPMNFEYKAATAQGASVTVPFPNNLVGSRFRITVTAAGLANEEVVTLTALPLYPDTNAMDYEQIYPQTQTGYVGNGTQDLLFEGTNPKGLTISFQYAEATPDIKITKIEYLGGN